MITSPISRPITSRIASAIAGARYAHARVVADYYVSGAASNGYVIGDNSNSGTSREEPWLTLDKAVESAPSGSVIALNDGTYTAATYYHIVKSLEIIAENRGQAVLKQNGQARVIHLRDTSGGDRTLRLSGLVIDGEDQTTHTIDLGGNDTDTVKLILHRCEVKGGKTWSVYTGNQLSDVEVWDSEFNSSYSTHRSHIEMDNVASGGLYVNGLTARGSSSAASAVSVVSISAIASGVSCHLARLDIERPTDSAGLVRCVYILNIDNAVVENSYISVTSETSDAAGVVIESRSASLTANYAAVRYCEVDHNAYGGYGIIVGRDGSGDGDGNQNYASVHNNTVNGGPNQTTPIHGLMLGFGIGGEVYDNTVTGCGLATIAKAHSGGEFYNNTISEFGDQAIRAKGSSDTEWHDNTIAVSSGFLGTPVYIDADSVDSDSILITDNVINVNAAPTRIVFVADDNTATFSGNTYNINTSLSADSWEYQSTMYQTLAAWKAVEPDALP